MTKIYEDIPSDEKLYDTIFEDIKRINRMLSSYKAIKELETNFKKLNDFKFAQNSKINEALFSGKIDISQAEQLKNNNYAKEIFTFSCNNLHSIE